MLLWQRIAWHRRYTFLSKLFFFSAIVHSTMLFVVFFLYRGENAIQHINLDAQNMTVMFLPFQKTVAKESTAFSSSPQSQAGFKVVKASSAEKNKQKKTAKKNEAPSSTSTPKTSLVASIKKINKKEKAQKQKKTDALKKEEKPIEKKIVEEVKEENPVLADAEQDNAGEDVLYAGQQDLAALELRQEIRDEIEQVWRPPVGLSSASCKVRVLVDWSGKVEELEFEESSKVLAFDASVRHALLTMKFPKSSYGKELILPFH